MSTKHMEKTFATLAYRHQQFVDSSKEILDGGLIDDGNSQRIKDVITEQATSYLLLKESALGVAKEYYPDTDFGELMKSIDENERFYESNNSTPQPGDTKNWRGLTIHKECTHGTVQGW